MVYLTAHSVKNRNSPLRKGSVSQKTIKSGVFFMHGEFYRSIADLAPLLKEELPSCVLEAIFFLETSMCRSVPGLPYPITIGSKAVQIIYPQQHWGYLIKAIRRYRRTASVNDRKLITRFMKIIRPLLPEETSEPVSSIPPMIAQDWK